MVLEARVSIVSVVSQKELKSFERLRRQQDKGWSGCYRLMFYGFGPWWARLFLKVMEPS